MAPRRSLNILLLAFGVGTMVVFTGIFGIVSYLIEQRDIETNLRAECGVVTGRLAGALALPMWNYDVTNIRANILAEAQSRDVGQIVVIDENGSPVAWGCRFQDGTVQTGSGPLPGASAVNEPFHTAREPLLLNGKVLGSLAVSVSKAARMQDFVSQILTTISLFLLNTLACIAVLLLGVRNLIVHRITVLSQIVSEFTASGFVKRMPSGRPDEIGQLAQSFNSMAQTISEYSHDMERQVQVRTSQLVEAEKLAFLGSLITGFSHELNTPLGIALTATTFQEAQIKDLEGRVQTGTVSPQELLTYLQDLSLSQTLVQDNLERTNRLVLTFKSVGVDQIQSDINELPLKTYLEEILVTLQPQLKEGGIEVVLGIPADLKIKTSPSLLFQIFSVLLLNAATHAYPPGQGGRVTIEGRAERGQLHCQMKDQGKGIPDELMHRVFTPFFTTCHQEGAVGLGLYIVYTAVKNLEGTIVCSKPQEGGLQFSLTLPLAFHRR